MLIDTSESVRSQWNARAGIQDFIRFFISQLTFGPNSVYLTAQSFADVTFVNWNLDTYQNRSSLVAQVSDILFRGTQETDYADALDAAITTQFGPGTGDRPNVPNYIIILTDGAASYDRSIVLNAVRKAESAGFTIFAIGYGPADRNVLTDLTGGNSDQVFHTQDYQDLVRMIETIVHLVCDQAIPPSPVTPGPTPQTPFGQFDFLPSFCVVT